MKVNSALFIEHFKKQQRLKNITTPKTNRNILLHFKSTLKIVFALSMLVQNIFLFKIEIIAILQRLSSVVSRLESAQMHVHKLTLSAVQSFPDTFLSNPAADEHLHPQHNTGPCRDTGTRKNVSSEARIRLKKLTTELCRHLAAAVGRRSRSRFYKGTETRVSLAVAVETISNTTENKEKVIV